MTDLNWYKCNSSSKFDASKPYDLCNVGEGFVIHMNSSPTKIHKA